MRRRWRGFHYRWCRRLGRMWAVYPSYNGVRRGHYSINPGLTRRGAIRRVHRRRTENEKRWPGRWTYDAVLDVKR